MPKQQPVRVASMNPDNMVSAGLADDFDGQITEARVVPWDYDGKLDHDILAVRLTIEPDEDSGFEEFTQHYSAGDLEYFVPSMDGKSPVDLDADDKADMEGVYAFPTGAREQLNNNSNWADFLFKLRDAEFPPDDMDADVRFVEGLAGHFNRVPQQKRSGIVRPSGDGDTRQKTILVVTEISEAKPKTRKKRTSKKSSKSTTKSTPKVDSDLDYRIEEVILEALVEAEELPKAKLPGLVIKVFAGAEKAKAVKRAASVEYLNSREAWEFDEDEGVLTLA